MIPKVEICAEIPFVDGAEGACSMNIEKKSRLIGAAEWKAQRPYMIMIHADYWSEIKKSWLKACRMPGAGQKCNLALESVDTAIRNINEAAEFMMGRKN